MPVNKVIYYGETLVDMSTVSVRPETLLKGETALDASGELIEGTLVQTQLPELTNPGTAENLLEGTQLIDAEGNVVEGAMVNNGAVTEVLDANNISYTIPEGYQDGNGVVKINTIWKTVTPTKSTQVIPAAEKEVFTVIEVNPIPDEYVELPELTNPGTAEDLAVGKQLIDAEGNVVTGTAEAGGDEEITIDPAKTYIFIHMGTSRKSPRLGVCVNGTVSVDWGDGTAVDTLTGTSVSTLKYTEPHTYAESGDYVITLTTDGEARFAGTSGRSRILCAESAVSDIDYAYLCAINKVIMGNCMKGIGAAAFYYCSSLTDVVIPDSVTSIAANAFGYCYYLNNVVIPAGVTKILASTFVWCYAVTHYDFSSHTSVPTLANVSVFNGISSDCEIRVPAALYDEWIAATNWATYASQIVAV